MAWGRGGAGNYEAAAAASKATESDVEAQKPTPGPVTASAIEAKPAEYAHMGRGGAGNFYSPQELDATGNFADGITNNTSKTDDGTIKQTATAPVMYRGRGGAGNYEATAAMNSQVTQRTVEQEQSEQKNIQSQVARDVDTGLARPEKAKLPHPDARPAT